MAENMWMPDTPEEFIDGFKFVDDKEVYTNGAELISVLRVRQMMEHYFGRVQWRTCYCPICDKHFGIVSNDSMGNCPECGHHVVLHRKED